MRAREVRLGERNAQGLELPAGTPEFTGAGPFASFARQVCGIEAKTDKTEYQATADYAKAQDTGRRAVNIQAAE